MAVRNYDQQTDFLVYVHFDLDLRHGPFDIQGGGGAWNFGPGREIFFGQNRSKIIVFAGPSGRIIIFFITKSYIYDI